jgi:hypothetical protein
MKYLTKKRWAAARALEGGGSWGKALRAYREQLETLRPRFPDQVFAFFDRSDIHEGELLHLDVRDGCWRTPPGRQPRQTLSRSDHPVRVNLAIRDVYERQVWSLRYGAVRKVVVDFPSETPLSHREGEGFGDVGCHELSDCGGGFYRHEILFASGATLLFEFKDIDIDSSWGTPGDNEQAGPG